MATSTPSIGYIGVGLMGTPMVLRLLDAVLAVARETRTALPLASLTAELHRLMAAKGLADADGTSLHRLYDRIEPGSGQ
jgi:3-hydroxyisobutyrate dehydrogenase-like beta-hydroxyacid dehydrogenase